jgi:hypothetical protein
MLRALVEAAGGESIFDLPGGQAAAQAMLGQISQALGVELGAIARAGDGFELRRTADLPPGIARGIDDGTRRELPPGLAKKLDDPIPLRELVEDRSRAAGVVDPELLVLRDYAANGYTDVERTLATLDRAASLLARGDGRAGALLLASAATEARNALERIDGADEQSPVLESIAQNLRLRAEGLRAIATEDARERAEALRTVAAITEDRAAFLDARQDSAAARFLRALAAESRAQADLLGAAAASTDSLIGRALENSLIQMAMPGSPPRAIERDPGLASAFRSLDRQLASDLVPFHVSIADNLLAEHPLTKPLIPPLERISRALAEGDPTAANRAGAELRQILSRDPGAASALDRIQPPEQHAAALQDVRDRVLPSLFLHAIMHGGLGPLLADSAGLRWWLAHIQRGRIDPRRLTAAEQIAGDLFRGAPGPWPGLDPTGGTLLLGHPGLFEQSGALTQIMRAQRIVEPSSMLPEPSLDPARTLKTLAPIGASERMVLVDADGKTLVRTDRGVTWFDGHIDAPDGNRFYYASRTPIEGISTVVYQSALDATDRRTRIDLSVEDPTEDERRRRRPWPAIAEPEPDLVAIVLLDEAHPEDTRVLGFSDRRTARVAAEELARLNGTLPEEHRIEHVWLDSADDCELALRTRDRAKAEEARAKLSSLVEELGADPRSTSALVVLCRSLGRARLRSSRADDPSSLVATFVSAAKQEPEHHSAATEYLEDLDLMQSGVLFYRRYAQA